MSARTCVTNEGLRVWKASLAVIFLLTVGLHSCDHEDLLGMGGGDQQHRTETPTVAAAPRPSGP